MIAKINSVREKACLRMAHDIVEKEQAQHPPQIINNHTGPEEHFYEPNNLANNDQAQTNQIIYNPNLIQNNQGNNFPKMGNQGFQPYNPGNF